MSFRSVLVIVVTLYCFFPGRLIHVSFIDKAVIAVAASINGIQRGPADIGLVVIPDGVAESWQADVYQADTLALLLANILHSSNASIGLVSSNPLNSQVSELERVLRASDTLADSAKATLNKKYYIRTLLADNRVVLGSINARSVAVPPLSYSVEHAQANILQAIKRWYTTCIACEEVGALQNADAWYHVSPGRSFDDNLWLESGRGEYPNFLNAFLLNQQAQNILSGVERTQSPPGLLDARIRGDADTFALPLGSFVSAHKISSSLRPRLIRLTLDDALIVSAFPRYVFVTPERYEAQVRDHAAALYSLMQKQSYVAPWWIEPLLRFCLLCFVLYVAFVHVRLKNKKLAWSIISAIFVVMLAISLSFAIIYRWWLPLSSLLSAAILLLGCVSVWRIQREQSELQRKELTSAIDRAGYLLESAEHYGDAMSLLAHYPDTRIAANKICRLAKKMEEAQVPLQSVVTMMNSLIPVLGESKQLNEKLALLKQTLADGGHYAHTQAREPAIGEDIPSALGRYQIQSELGRGAVGVVYLGFDPAISRQVAIKTLDARQFSKDQHENLKARFFREAEAAGRLNHPNIVSVYDVGEEGDLAFIAMDYVDGKPLSDCITASERLYTPEVYRIVHDVAMALSYAHDNQIVHRDIKPGNLMYCDEPYTLKVADFGIARLLDNSKTSTGEILGSPLYMAPEQLKGSKVSPTADIFSLGVTFYQLLTSELPFNADNLASLTYEIIHSKHKNVRAVRKDLPASAARVINQCLQKKPDDRYETAAELASVLRKAIRRDFPAEAKSWNML